MIAKTPKPPYYAVIFTTLMTDDLTEYEATAQRMEALAEQQEGYLGIESARSGIGITVSYWSSLEAIKRWKMQAEHTAARDRGRAQWYDQYELRICKVEHAYGFKK
ncbi:antibiotic biosynthesis monooxygenase [Urechidicola sp. KH5]